MSPLTLIALAANLTAPVSAIDCPHDRVAAQQWVARQAHMLKEGSYYTGLSQVQENLERCRGALAQIPSAERCAEPLARFTRAQLWETQDDHLLGMEQTDAEWLSTAPYPEMISLPPQLTETAFLRLLDKNDRQSLDAAQARIAEVNNGISEPAMQWKVFEYVSQHLYTPDGTSTLGRFFVYVPGRDFDRYLQFGLQDDPSNPIPNSVSIVAVQKTDPRTHTSLTTPQARAIDLWRLRESDGSYQITTRYAVTHSVENCYGCHKSAVLPVTPEPSTFDSARYGQTVSFVNKQMSRYGHVEMAGQDVEGYGPGLGPLDFPTRTDRFIASCAQGRVAPNRIARIKDLMTCEKCHDGDTRGLLNYPSTRRSSPPSNHSLVEDYVVTHRKMPPGADDLTLEERKVLFSCVKQEYYDGDGEQPGVLESWLAGGECWSRN